jgi:hypothetical protein
MHVKLELAMYFKFSYKEIKDASNSQIIAVLNMTKPNML